MFNRMEKRISAGLSMWMLLWMLTVVVGQDTQLRQDYSSQEINEDLDRMYAILSSMHPGLHLYTTPKDLRRSFEQARVPVGESRSLRSAYVVRVHSGSGALRAHVRNSANVRTNRIDP